MDVCLSFLIFAALTLQSSAAFENSTIRNVRILSKSIEKIRTILQVLQKPLLRAGPKPPWNETYSDKLRNDLLTNYDKYAGPYTVLNEVVWVYIAISITYLETDEVNSTISVSARLKLFWIDESLGWSEPHYGGIKEIKMADHEIWQPDIYLYNSAAGGEALNRYGNLHTVVHSKGVVVWTPPSKFVALCEFDLYYWPFDTQHCYLQFASWSHSGNEIELKLHGNKSSYALLTPSVTFSPWKVDVSGVKVIRDYKCCKVDFHSAYFNLVLTRKSSSYIAVIVTPIIVIVSLILMQPCLPSASGERIILSCCTGVAVTILLTYFAQKMSAMGAHTPWIVTFYSTSLYLVVLSMIESVLVRLILATKHTKSLPWIIKRYLQGRLGTWLLLKHSESQFYALEHTRSAVEMGSYHFSEFDENIAIERSTSKDAFKEEWKVFAIALDRIAFLIYFVIYFILLMCYIF